MKDAFKVAGHGFWVMFAAFALPALAIGLVAALLIEFEVITESMLTAPSGLMALFALQFMVGFLVMLLYPFLVQKKTFSEVRNLLGVRSSPLWKTIAYAAIALLGYFVVTTMVQLLVMQLFPGYDADQVQDLGFSTDVVGVELLIAGLALVLLAPVFEELIFRGYLFGVVRPYLTFLGTALVVSVLFAIAHGQVNVAVDVFVLSMFMSYVREKTGTIWGPILMHMSKNALAFTLLFVIKIDPATLSLIPILK